MTAFLTTVLCLSLLANAACVLCMVKVEDNFMFTLMKWVPNWILYYAVITAWSRATTSERFSHLTPDSLTWDMVRKFLEGNG